MKSLFCTRLASRVPAMGLALALVCTLSGCVTKGKAAAQARAAFLAGQQQALRMQAAPQEKAVTIVGEVRNPLLPWRADLTLAQAIIEAGYSGAADPSDIVLVHNGQATQVEINQLLAGQDRPLQPGDIIRIK